MLSTSFAELDSPERLRAILAERGYFPEEAPVDKQFDLPPDQAGLLRGAQIVALAGPAPDDNTLVVLHVPRSVLPLETLRRIRRKLAENTRDGLIFCTEGASWQKATLYLLRQEDIPQPGQEQSTSDKPLEWKLNFNALRPADRQGLALLDLRDEDPYELGTALLRAFRRAQRTTIYQNQGLFSNYYLNERFEQDNEAHNTAWRALAANMSLLRSQVETALAAGVDGLDAAASEARVIRPLLHTLGWKLDGTSSAGQIDLRVDSDTVAFCHMLPFDAPLDLAPLPGDLLAPPPLSPDMQLIGRLAGQKHVLWGILTNGRTWRLLSRQATSTSGVFYEIDLRDLLEIGAPDNRDLRWFAAFFGAAWLHAPPNQPGLLDMVYQSGQLWAETLGNNLKAAIFTHVFVDFANALAEGERRAGREPDLPTVYRATLVLLYRLLFVLYAESRRLLPLTNAAYYPNSLTYMLSTLALMRSGPLTQAHDFSLQTDDPRLWHKLRALFAAIGAGRAEWNVPHYNGGLFGDETSEAHKLLARLDVVANDNLGEGLDRLARDEDARGARDENAALRLIDYMDLNVRRLGSIYEGLLEFQLRRADTHGEIVEGRLAPVAPKKNRKNSGRLIQAGEVYLETTRQDRKASGSYYTPDYIVKYIVEQTVGPVLDGRAARFAGYMNTVRTLQTSIKRANDGTSVKLLRGPLDAANEAAIDALLDIKVLDPAMGSGHFLVEAVNYLSDHIITILNKHPDNPLLPRLAQVRKAVRENLQQQGIAGTVISDEQLSDRVLLRRMVMKRCIYGVDLNEMAVDLAKLSLWLDSFAVGAPLSFLDHHLRWGNSLVGVWDVEKYIDVSSPRGQKFMNALGYMVQVTRLTDSTVDEVAESKQLYESAQAELQPFRAQFNVDLAVHFAALGDVGRARQIPHQTADARAAWDAVTLGKFDTAQAEADTRRFFHWKLEFPEVFLDHEQREWKADGAAGFDAVVGNPPWGGDIDPTTYKYFKVEFSDLHQRLPDTTKYFFGTVNRNVAQEGFVGQIIPNVLLHFQEYEKWRILLIEKYTLFDVVNLGENIFDKVTAPCCVIIAEKTSPLSDSVSRIWDLRSVDRKAIAHLPKNYIIQVEQKRFRTLPNHVFTVDAFAVNALPRIYSMSDTIDSLASSVSLGVHTGNNDAFILDAEQANTENIEQEVRWKLLTGSDIDRYYTAEEPKQEILYIKWDDSAKDIPNTVHYLEKFKNELLQRREAKQGKMPWFALHWARYRDLYTSPKIMCRQTADTLVATVDIYNHCALNSTIIIKPNSNIYSPFFWTALLNARLQAQIYGLLSQEEDRVFAEVKPANLRRLPIRRIHFTTPANERTRLVGAAGALATALLADERGMPLQRGANGWPRYAAAAYRATMLGQRIAALLPQDAAGNFLAFAQSATGAEEQSDVVHDLLAALAEQMIDLNKHKQAETKGFLGWLETQLDITSDKDRRSGIDSLPGKTTLQDYVGDYQKNEAAKTWDEVYAVLHKNRRRFVNDYWLSGMFMPQLKAAYESSLATLLPLKARLARTDALIDQIVYQLYGLTLDEIAVVEGT